MGFSKRFRLRREYKKLQKEELLLVLLRSLGIEAEKANSYIEALSIEAENANPLPIAESLSIESEQSVLFPFLKNLSIERDIHNLLNISFIEDDINGIVTGFNSIIAPISPPFPATYDDADTNEREFAFIGRASDNKVGTELNTGYVILEG